MSKGLGSSVSNVEFEATGKHMLEVSKKLQDKGLLKWLNEITKAEDTAVNHAVYRNRCWTNGRSEVRPRQKKKDRISHILSEIETINIVQAQ